MIHVTLLKDGALEMGGVELFDQWTRANGDRIWVDVEGEPQEVVEPLLESHMGFHELAAEDAFSENTLPKFDPFATYDFFVFRSVNINLLEHGVATSKLAVFLSQDYLFTVHAEPMLSVDTIRQRIPQDRRIIEKGTDFLLYSILDVLVDLHFPLLDEIEEMVDEIQDLMFKAANPQLLDELLNLKKDLNTLRRYSLPQRELFNQLSRGDAKFIQRDHLIYFRDLYDHMFRISESIDVGRDLVAGTMEAYLSIVSNRTNDIMKVLTVFSAIMLPLNLVAAIYGMNFVHMPELQWQHGYAFALGVMAFVAVIMLLYFVDKGWVFSRKDILKLRRHSYKAITWPVRLVRVGTKKVVKEIAGSRPPAH